MADASVIVELLRQAQEERNRPSGFQQGLGQLTQVMEGVLKGIQLYDAAKGMGLKYGSTVREPVPGTGSPATPGIPGIPAQPPQEALPPLSSSEAPLSRQIPALGDEFFKSLLKPGMQTATSRMGLSGMQGSGIPGSPGIPSFPTPSTRTLDLGTPAVPAVPGSPAVPPQTVNRFLPGAAQLEMIKHAKDISPELGRSTGKRFGVDIGNTIDEQRLNQLTPVATGKFDAEGKPIFEYVKGKPSNILLNSDDKAKARAQRDAQIQIARDTLAEKTREFEARLQATSDQKEKSRLDALGKPFIKVLTDKKFANDKGAIQFANDVLEEIELTGQVPEITFERAKVFGIELPAAFGKGTKKIVKTGKKAAALTRVVNGVTYEKGEDGTWYPVDE